MSSYIGYLIYLVYNLLNFEQNLTRKELNDRAGSDQLIEFKYAEFRLLGPEKFEVESKNYYYNLRT